MLGSPHAFALVLLAACASSPPPRPATEVAVGSRTWNRVELPEWAIELPAEALSHVQITWRDGERRAELSLTGAAIGSSVERLADDEANAMRALDPELGIARRRTRVSGVTAIGLTQGERDVLVAMRNPWRAFRLAVRGGSADAWLGDQGRVAGIGVEPQWALESARFQCAAYIIDISHGESSGESLASVGAWTLRVRVSTNAPEDLERIRSSFSARP